MVSPDEVVKLLAPHGELRAQDDRQWTGEVPLPEPVAAFYASVGPSDITVDAFGNPYFLPRLAALWGFQAGYRWNAVTAKSQEDWRSEWLVVADQGGEPFIYAVNSGRVLVAHHGEGAWSPRDAFSDLLSMAGVFGILGSVVHEAGLDFTDDDCNVRPEHRATAIARLAVFLGAEERAQRALEIAEW